MKTILKLFSLIMAILLLFNALAIGAGAQAVDEEELHQKFIAYLDEHNVKHTMEDIGGGPPIETSFSRFMLMSIDSTIFYGGAVDPGNPRYIDEYIGNYHFFSSNEFEPYPLGIYAEKAGVIKTLQEAYHAQEVDLNEIAAFLIKKGNREVTVMGDVTGDYLVDMEDVLCVQKYVAGLVNDFPDGKYAEPDYNKDGYIKMEDVLLMQRYIAMLEE